LKIRQYTKEQKVKIRPKKKAILERNFKKKLKAKNLREFLAEIPTELKQENLFWQKMSFYVLLNVFI
jgi:tRNA A22 N-methylase